MKIAYVIGEYLNSRPGLKSKVMRQASIWEDCNNEVYLLSTIDESIHDPIKKTRHTGHLESRSKGGIVRRAIDEPLFVERALKKLNPDLVYCRYPFPSRRMANALKGKHKVVIEVNSNDKQEYYNRGRLQGIYNHIFRKNIFGIADGLIFVTNELATSESFRAFTENRAVIANGSPAIRAFEKRGSINSNIQLVFAGAPDQSWQGVDKLFYIASALPHYTLHIAGFTKEQCLREWPSLPENVVFHGSLSHQALDDLLHNMDIAISTLALHRKSMSEACPLKSRQYLSHLLPIISAYNDTDLEGTEDFVLQLENSEDNISGNIIKIDNFIMRTANNERIRAEIRQFVSEKLLDKKKEDRRLKFFEETVKKE